MIDLRKLMMMIKEQKQMNANLSLEFDCEIDYDDPTSLVKVFNYLINYLTPLTDKPIEISLNPCREGYMLSFAVFSSLTEVPALSANLNEALQQYNASLDVTHQQGDYLQLIIIFNKA